jgi:hypothetical protein
MESKRYKFGEMDTFPRRKTQPHGARILMHYYWNLKKTCILEGYIRKYACTLLVLAAQNPHDGDEAFKHFIQLQPLVFTAEL